MPKNNNPYKQENLESGVIKRTFDTDVDPSELVWHRDKRHRVVTPTNESDWMIQFDNELPKKLIIGESIIIPKESYHRVIKGTNNLIVEIEEFDSLEEAKKKKPKRDACYHKVKSRYDVWPSAYGSGALVQCRKVGAENWGNKSEEVDITEDTNAVNEISDFMHYIVNSYKDERIVMSHESVINFRPTPIDKQQIGPKPNGFWYGFGSSWLDWVRSEMPNWETDFVHLVKVNESKILKISTFEELLAFTEKFGVESDYVFGGSHPKGKINWPEVAKIYSGIEINPYIYKARMKFMWYYPWDVASGCVWGEDGIVSIELLDEDEFQRDFDEASGNNTKVEENKETFQDIALDKIQSLGGFDNLPDIDKLALLGGTDDNRLKSLNLLKIYKENGGTFGNLNIKVKIKDVNQQPINHEFSKEFAGKEGYLTQYIQVNNSTNKPYVTVRFDEFISHPDSFGGGTYEHRPIYLANMFPIDYDEIKSTFADYQNKVDFEKGEFNSGNPIAEKTDYSKEKDKGLHGWFERRGGGGSQGWVDCNTCREDSETGRKKCKPCGRKEGESRSKYPACRPTPSACKTKGKGKKWGKKTENTVSLIKDMLREFAETEKIDEMIGIYRYEKDDRGAEPDIAEPEVKPDVEKTPKRKIGDSPFIPPRIKPNTKPKAGV